MFEDIETGVHISLETVNGSSLDVSCVPYQDLYVRGSRIVCRIQRPENNTLATSGPVVTNVRDQFTARSKQKYTFVDPTIVSITPDKGPKSGGTDIEIRGAFLNTGSTAEISVGGVPCHLTKRQEDLLTCRTSRTPMAGQGRLVVKFDDGQRELGEYMFTFVEDPVIDSVESAHGGTPARGTPSGGLTVYIKGRNLDVVREPAMYVTAGSQRYYGKCVPESPQHLKCRSPAVSKGNLHFEEDPAIPLELEYGVCMDGAESGQNLVANRGFKPFQMFRDPVYLPFSEDGHVKELKNDYLVIA
ncbi:unnamed protein product, partial [Ixodes pacificus]